MGINECQNQFHSQRWNCSTFDEPVSIFGGVLSISKKSFPISVKCKFVWFPFFIFVESRERAYVYAISAAGAAYAVTRACSRGEITECGCDGKIRQRQAKGFEWGGCSEVLNHYTYMCCWLILTLSHQQDITFGEKFSKEFVDAREDDQNAEGLMNLHNNEAGRRVSNWLIRYFDYCDNYPFFLETLIH